MNISFNRAKVWGLVILFALPALLALTLYSFRDQVNLTSKSEGELLLPPLMLSMLQLTTIEDLPLPPDTFEKHWWLIYVTPSSCTDACAMQMAKLHSVHLSLNKNISRVKRVMFLNGNSLSTEQLQQAHQDKSLTLAKINNPSYLFSNCHLIKDNGIYIMDPLGNIMLCYGPNQEAHAILQDIEKLLKASRIG